MIRMNVNYYPNNKKKTGSGLNYNILTESDFLHQTENLINNQEVVKHIGKRPKV